MITNEIKAKVFAQYLGQKVVTVTRGYLKDGRRTSQFLKGELKEIDLGMVSDVAGVLLENETDPCNHVNYTPGNECKLILKPLSAISDEDAIEVANTFSDGNEWHVTARGSFWRCVVDKRSNNEVRIMLGSASISYVRVYQSSVHDNGKMPLQAYQYLQSQGYDLPMWQLGGKTLFESGLAVYE